jgi:Arc/MetJ family transcription regulator
MSKRLIDVDDEKLDAVRAVLGTRTLRDTVNSALDEVLALEARRRALLADRGAHTDDLAALADSAARRAAWR